MLIDHLRPQRSPKRLAREDYSVGEFAWNLQASPSFPSEAGEEEVFGMVEGIVRSGGCLCGAVRYEVRGEPFKVGLCHCTVCRQITGSAFLAFGDWKAEQFTYSGEVASYAGRSFCPTCGARLFDVNDTQAEIFLGTLDDAPNDVQPDHEIWVKRREHWLPALPVPQFEEDKH
ncbi:MAG TPA: GFA family protein [Devosiaceae bacterium]|nr:GFA family protein [Devosiaceae bacterium]